jgi:hypothetical protein
VLKAAVDAHKNSLQSVDRIIDMPEQTPNAHHEAARIYHFGRRCDCQKLMQGQH